MLNIHWTKLLVPLAILLAGFAGMHVISLTKPEEEAKPIIDTRPVVDVQKATLGNYPSLITGFGEVAPFEQTNLAAQVSGAVIEWNPDFVPGGIIASGEILFSVEPERYEAALLQASAAVSQAEAALIQERAVAAVAEKEAQRTGTTASDLYLRKPQLFSAEASLKSAQANLKIAQRDLDNAVIRAPYDALIVSRRLGKGQFVSQGEIVAELFNLEYAEITFPIAGFDTRFLPEQLTNLPAIVKTNQGDIVERDALIARDTGIVDSDTRMTQLVARITDPYGLKNNLTPIKFGSYAEVSFISGELENLFLIPQELVNAGTVWVVGSDQRLQSRKVTVLREQGAFFLISNGLNEGEKILKTIPDYPHNGMEVRFLQNDEPHSPDISLSDLSSPSLNSQNTTAY